MRTATASTRPPNDTGEQHAARYAETHEESLRAEIVGRYENLCALLASRYARGPDSFEDLRQQANVALLKALDRFDPSRNVRFTTYAWVTISGELKRYLRDHTWRVRVPRSLQETYLRVRSETDELRIELGREPTRAEVAEECRASERDVDAARGAESAFAPASLDAVPDVAETAATGEWSLRRVEDRRVLEQLLAALPARSRKILWLHYFEGLPQSSIGRRLGISQVHVSRLLGRSLEVLRRRANELQAS
jgi:RNA polymerase sigma-B factor